MQRRKIDSKSPPKRIRKVSNRVKDLEKLAEAEREKKAEKRKTLDTTLESFSPLSKMPNSAQQKEANATVARRASKQHKGRHTKSATTLSRVQTQNSWTR